MPARRALLLVFALAALLLVLWKVERVAPNALPPPAAPALSQISNLRSQIPARPAASEPRSTLADALNSPAGDIRADLRVVLDLVEAFRTNFPRDGNPVGTNADITAALAGRNRLGLALLPPDHPAINRNGELCDRWGTPFFFHAESATRLEIRSAGPDKKMWTADDELLAP